MAATIAVITSTMQAREGVSAGRAGGGASLLDDASSSPLHKIRPPRACIEVVIERGDLETERAGSFSCLSAGGRPLRHHKLLVRRHQPRVPDPLHRHGHGVRLYRLHRAGARSLQTPPPLSTRRRLSPAAPSLAGRATPMTATAVHLQEEETTHWRSSQTPRLFRCTQSAGP